MKSKSSYYYSFLTRFVFLFFFLGISSLSWAYDVTQTLDMTNPVTKLTFTFTNLPHTSDLKTYLYVDLYGDFDSGTEEAYVSINGGSNVTIPGGDSQCNTTTTSNLNRKQILVSANDIASGTLTVEVSFHSSVDYLSSGCANRQYVKAQLAYPSADLRGDYTPTASKSSANVGDTVDLTCTYSWNGVSTLSNVKLAAYLSSNSLISSADTKLSETTIASISAGTVTYTFTGLTIPADKADGTWYLGCIIDSGFTVSDATSGNDDSPGLAIALKSKDFEPLTFTNSLVDSAKKGTSKQVTFSFKYTGNVSASSVKIAIVLSTNTNLTTTADVDLLTFDYDNNGAGFTNGNTYTVIKTVTIPSGTTPGSYYIGAILDSDSQHDEINEGNNNDKYASLLVYDSIDFVANSVTVDKNPAQYKAGDSVNVGWNFTYNGVNLPTTDEVYVYFYITTDSSFSSGLVYLGNDKVGSLTNGVTKSGTKTLTIPAGYDGVYYIGYKTDGSGRFSESDETNNTKSTEINVYNTADIEAVSFSTAVDTDKSIGYMKVGNKIKYTYTIKNTSNAPLKFYYKVLRSEDATVDNSDTTVVTFLRTFAANETYTSTYSYTIPSGWEGKRYYFGLSVDTTDLVSESDETNNIKSYASPSYFYSTIDLKGTSVSFTNDKNHAKEGESVNMTVNFDYSGTTTLPPYIYIRLYKSTATTYAGGTSTSLAVVAVSTSSFVVGANSYTKAITIPSGTGTFYLGAILDYPDYLIESDETNNEISSKFAVTNSLDFSVTSFSVAGRKPYMKVGESITFSYSIKYTADANAPKTFWYRIVYSTDATIDASDPIVPETNGVKFYEYDTSVAPGDVISGTKVLTLPTSFAGKNYYFGIVADYPNYMEEDDENNNFKGYSLPIFTHQDIDLSASSLAINNGFHFAKSGNTVSVTVKVKHLSGSETLPNVYTRIFWSTSTTYTSGDPVVYKTFTDLAPNSEGTYTYTLTIPAAAPGDYQVTFEVDYLSYLTETNEANNKLSQKFTVYNNIDLKQQAVVLKDSSYNVLSNNVVKVGDKIYLYCSYQYPKNGDATQAILHDSVYYQSHISASSTGFDGQQTEVQRTNVTPSTSSFGLNHAITVPAKADGLYYFGCKIDSKDLFAETDETNNVVNIPVYIYNSIDFSATTGKLSVSKNYGKAGTSSINFDYDFLYGTGDGTVGSVTAKFYLSLSGTLDGSETLVKTLTFTNVAKGSSLKGSSSFVVPSVGQGKYKLIAKIDGDNAFAETNESNNTDSTDFTVYESIDLVAKSIEITSAKTTIQEKEKFDIKYIYEYSGGTVTLPEVKVNIRLSTNNIISTGDVAVYTTTLTNVTPGSHTITLTNIEMPKPSSEGLNYLGLLLDESNVLSESNESNNNKASDSAYTVYSTSDLKVNSISLTKTSGKVGTLVGVNCSMTNSSSFDMAAVTIHFYLSTNATIDGADRVLSSLTIPLNKGQTQTAYVPVTIPAGVAAGSYYIGYWVDSNNAYLESDETNNTASSLFYVTEDKDGDGYEYVAGCPVAVANCDCNDNDKNIYPSAVETCNGKDDNCDGKIDETFTDKDGDGYTTCLTTTKDGKIDCNDNDKTIYPGAVEICNGKDDDCDGRIDNQAGTANKLTDTCYSGPAGTKGVGVCQGGTKTCNAGVWSACVGEVTPATTEVCDGTLDQNCNGKTDAEDGCDCNSGATKVCGSNVGECKQYTQTCIDGKWNECKDTKATTEICDGKDNDCDGAIDNGVDKDGDTYTTCGYYYNPATKTTTLKAVDCNDNDAAIYPGATETCDGKDNDCDGRIDNQAGTSNSLTQACYTGATSTKGVGECKGGTQTCGAVKVGEWGSCAGEVVPVAEVCNGKDDNCDGSIDEGMDKDGDTFTTCGYYYNPTTKITTLKAVDCNDNDKSIYPGATETCNGKDDDCDGKIDNKAGTGNSLSQSCYTGAAGSKGVGVCKEGVQTCGNNGAWGACTGEITPADETCNGKDDDCDGFVDEDPTDQTKSMSRTCYSGPAGTKGVGECQGGTQTCTAGKWPTACAGEVTPLLDTTCDGKDNDCDGSIDEDVVGLGDNCSVGTGECLATGKKVCDVTKKELVCDAVEKAPATEICDGKDNDCDGSIDEDFPQTHVNPATGKSTACTSGQGVCANDGYYVCKNNQQVCNAEPKPKQTASCNGLDNDCNGIPDVDELSSCTCTDGQKQACGNTSGLALPCKAGEQVCAGGKWGACVGEVKPSDEICDGIDNDCDGKIDNKVGTADPLAQSCYNGATGTLGKGECKAGAQTCSAGTWSTCVGEVLPTKEICNGKDDNCDGKIDEGNDLNNNGTIEPSETFDKDGDGFTTCGFVVDSQTQQVTQKAVDCNDNDKTIYPGAVETCNGKDDNCDGKIDETFTDKDNDGYTTCLTTTKDGKIDCNDNDKTIYPGAVEICNGKDDDCDGKIDNQADSAKALEKSCTTGANDSCSGIQTCKEISSGQFGYGDCVASNIQVEVCDGKDNDCNGLIDEGHDANKDGQISQNESFDKDGDGYASCGWYFDPVSKTTTAKALDCDDSDKNTYPGSVEVCDGQDNNCDGQVDEGFNVGSACSVGKGECTNTAAVIVCSGGKAVCQGNPLNNATSEICDGKDNDCDGVIDNGLNLGATCTVGKGECSDSNGKIACDNATLKAVCQGNPGTPAVKEKCDGKDDDCDGQVDNGFNLNQPCTVGKGACSNQGVTVCNADGSGVQCNATPGTPAKEVCEGKIDEDCDGVVDNGCACQDGTSRDCGPDKGECTNARGKQTCSGGLWGSCVGGAQTVEICDGKDNDCDGVIDEDFPQVINGTPLECTVGQGACLSVGKYKCNQAGNGVVCDATPKPPATKEKCDNVDDDCDGQVDNGFDVGLPCTVGKGACQTPGNKVCKADGLGTECKPSSAPPQPQTEVCNGVDDNCDGTIDEGFNVGKPCTVGKGVCERSSVWTCKNNQAVCDIQSGTPSVEVCDGKDNNCNGQIDEDSSNPSQNMKDDCYNGPQNSAGQGICKKGVRTCNNGQWTSCVGEVLPEQAISPLQPERCDGVDNNCNGQIDEGCACKEGDTKDCGSTLGECSSQTGKQTCGTNGQWGDCKNEVKGNPEICDGKDNDCDGKIDEDFISLGDSCKTGKGECESTGKYICNASKDGVTCDATAKQASAEVCDGLDNDCNGLIDDNIKRSCYSGAQGTDGVGTCKAGTQICTNGTWEACVGETIPTVEVCDKKDNNCDGQIDEGCTCTDGEVQECGDDKGLCKKGTQTCASGAWGSCTGETKPAVELCDNQDNDCDGLIDEDFSNLNKPCEVGVGACSDIGKFQCKADKTGTECSVQAKQGTTEICDGKDNDCDGLIDEDFAQLNEYCSVGQGSCATQGNYICKADGSGVECNASLGSIAVEVCDGVDNDCDGKTDEDDQDPNKSLEQKCYNGTSATKDIGACKTGKQVCTNGQWGACTGEVNATPEICDGIDNDCNGLIDDTLTCNPLETSKEEVVGDAGEEIIGDAGEKVGDAGEVIGDASEVIGDAKEVVKEAGEVTPEIIVEGTSCYEKGCPTGQLCQSGQCVADPCNNVKCPTGEFCRAGKCILSCGCKKCDDDQVCVDGQCQKNPCYKVECKQGETCDPSTSKCVEDKCPTQTCAKGRLCVLGNCVDDPCAGVQCSADLTCKWGQCVGKTCNDEKITSEVVKDAGENISDVKPDSSAEIVGDKSSEVVVDKSSSEKKPEVIAEVNKEKTTVEIAKPEGGCQCSSTNGSANSLLLLFFFLFGFALRRKRN